MSDPMNVVVFASGAGSNFRALLEQQNKGTTPFMVSMLFCDRRCAAMEHAEMYGVPVEYLSLVKFFKKQGITDRSDPRGRLAYDTEVANTIEAVAKRRGFSIDLIVLAGYMRLVSEPLLQRFKNKIITVHPADLMALDDRGRRRYVGKDAVSDALMAGESRTRSSVILVDEGTDTGPIVGRGPWVYYEGATSPNKENIEAHQEKQKCESDWPALVETVQRLATGETMNDLMEVQRCAESSVSSVTTL